MEKLLAKKRETKHSWGVVLNKKIEHMHNEEKRTNELAAKMSKLEAESARVLKAKDNAEQMLAVKRNTWDAY